MNIGLMFINENFQLIDNQIKSKTDKLIENKLGSKKYYKLVL